MTATAASLRRGYAIDGVGVGVCADDPAVVAAMDLRLRGFGPDPGAETGAGVRLEFTIDDQSGASRAPEPGRQVYDTRYGSLYYLPQADIVCGTLAGVQLRCEAARGVALFRSAAFSGRELYIATHPLATIALMELLERRGLFSLHAACVATADGRGVLLAGTSGAGKSTLAVALAMTGMSLLADDVVFLACDGDGQAVRVIGFADAIGLTEHAGVQFAAIRERLREPPADGFPKRLVRIEELFGSQAVAECRPEALIFPEVAADQESRVAPMDSSEALLRLVPDVLLTEPAATQAHLAAIGALLDRVQCYTLRSGTDLERAAQLVAGLV
jgi:hypothetical protein